MHHFLPLFLFCVVNTAPVENIKNELDNSTLKHDIEGQSKAGIVDTLNPFNKNEPPPASDQNKDNEQNSNPLTAIQGLFNNIPLLNSFNSTNPFQQLFSSNQGDNFLNDVKMFLVGTQGMVFPATAILGGFQNFMQNLGGIANLMQTAQNLIPSLPAGN